jgi:hypothetical protein
MLPTILASYLIRGIKFPHITLPSLPHVPDTSLHFLDVTVNGSVKAFDGRCNIRLFSTISYLLLI